MVDGSGVNGVWDAVVTDDVVLVDDIVEEVFLFSFKLMLVGHSFFRTSATNVIVRWVM